MATDPNHRGIMIDDLTTGRRPLHLSGQIECVTWSEMWEHQKQCKVLAPPSGW